MVSNLIVLALPHPRRCLRVGARRRADVEYRGTPGRRVHQLRLDLYMAGWDWLGVNAPIHLVRYAPRRFLNVGLVRTFRLGRN